MSINIISQHPRVQEPKCDVRCSEVQEFSRVKLLEIKMKNKMHTGHITLGTMRFVCVLVP